MSAATAAAGEVTAPGDDRTARAAGPYPAPVKRSLTLSGHRTSVSMEEPFWQEFRRLAEAEGLSVNALASRIDAARGSGTTLASAIRLHVLAALTGGR